MKRKLLALAALAAASAPAFAELPAGVEASIQGAYTDAAAAVGLMIIGAALIFAAKKVLGLFGR